MEKRLSKSVILTLKTSKVQEEAYRSATVPTSAWMRESCGAVAALWQQAGEPI